MIPGWNVKNPAFAVRTLPAAKFGPLDVGHDQLALGPINPIARVVQSGNERHLDDGPRSVLEFYQQRIGIIAGHPLALAFGYERHQFTQQAPWGPQLKPERVHGVRTECAE
jgi:hypothetical protein